MLKNKNQTINKKPSIREIRQEKQNLYFTTVSIALGTMLIFLFVFLSIDRTFGSYKVMDSFERKDSNTKGYLKYKDDKLIKYSADGISVLSKDGDLIWNASYEMKNPQVDVSGNYIGVADIGSNEAYIYDKKGNYEKVDNVYSIEQIEMSSNGLIALMVNDGMANYIKICSGKKNYIDIKTRVKEDGFPMDMAFSSDNKKLVTSYMCVKDGKMNNNVTFYNFGEVGKNFESKIVGACSFDEVMVPQVEFIDKNTVVLFAEDHFEVYEMKEVPKFKFESKPYKAQARNVLFDKDHVGVVLKNQGENENHIIIYNYDKKIELDTKNDYDYDNILLAKDDVIMYTSKDAQILRVSGKMKFNGRFNVDMEYILPYNYKERFYFITMEKVMNVKLSKGD